MWTASWAARPGVSEPQEADLVVKLFRVGDWTPRLSREFADEARCAPTCRVDCAAFYFTLVYIFVIVVFYYSTVLHR